MVLGSMMRGATFWSKSLRNMLVEPDDVSVRPPRPVLDRGKTSSLSICATSSRLNDPSKRPGGGLLSIFPCLKSVTITPVMLLIRLIC